jgi:large subunit ribosomal protein L6
MSRIGKIPVIIPKGVAATVQDGVITVKGPKGELRQEFDRRFQVKVDGGRVTIESPTDSKTDKALHGLYRALIKNMMTGCAEGFSETLEIEGVGYNAKAEGGSKVVLNIGFNAPRTLAAPKGVTVETPKPTVIVIKGSDRQKVGQFAAEVRAVRPPEPYKGKGIRYQGEHIIRKAGKAIGGKTA